MFKDDKDCGKLVATCFKKKDMLHWSKWCLEVRK